MCYIRFGNVHFLGLYEVNCIRLGFGQVWNLSEKEKNFGGKFCRGIRPQIRPVIGRIDRDLCIRWSSATASNLAKNPAGDLARTRPDCDVAVTIHLRF